MRALALSLVLFVACGAPSASDTPTEPTRTAAARSPLPTADAATKPGPGVAARQTVQVISVTDGDTIRVSIDGRSVPVRYIGIDTPETVDPRKDVQCFGKEASAFNASLVAGKKLELERDISDTDKYDRLLRYIWIDGKLVNEELVRAGYARSSSYPPDVKYQDRLRAAEADARANGVGLWAPSACAVTAPTLRPPVVTTAPKGPTVTPRPASTSDPRARCEPAYPDVCIAPAPPDLDCRDIPHRRFRVLPPDPHRLDGNNDGVGCES